MNSDSLRKWPGMPWMVTCPECGKVLDLNGGIYLPRHYTPTVDHYADSAWSADELKASRL